MGELRVLHADEPRLNSTLSATWVPCPFPCMIEAADLLPSTTYLVVAKGRFSADVVPRHSGIRVYTADDADIGDNSFGWVAGTNGPIQQNDFGFKWSYQTAASPTDIEFQIASGWAGVEGHADQLSLTLIDLDHLGSDNYVEDSVGAVDLGSDTQTTCCQISTLDAGTEYLLLGHVAIAPGSGTFGTATYLTVDGTAVAEQRREGEHVNEKLHHGLEGAFTTDPTTPETIETKGYAWSGFGDCLNSYLIAIKTAVFADFEYVYDAIGEAFTAQTTLETINYTPSQGGNHLIFGRFGTTTGSIVAGTVTADGAEVLDGDIDAYVLGDYDAIDEPATVIQGLIAISGQVDLNLDAISASGAETSAHEFLAVLNLNLAGPANGVVHGHRTPLSLGRR